MNPSLAGFITFVQTIMGIGTTYLPTNSPYLQLAYDAAISIVNPQLRAIRCPPTSPTMYAQAVYNLAGDTLVNIALDQQGYVFFSKMREKFNIDGFVGGVISSTGDEDTNQSMVVPEQIKTLTLGNLQNLKTPWGRAYLAIAQSVGSMWGLS